MSAAPGSTVRGAAAAATALIAALSLAGCAGDPEVPASSATPTGGSSSAPPASDAPSGGEDGFLGDGEEPELWWIVEEYDDAFVLAGAAGTFDDDGVTSARTDRQVPLDTSEFEVHVYCTPVGAAGVLETSSYRTDIECPGTEDPQVVHVSAEGLETSSDMSWDMKIDDSVGEWQQAVVFLPADS